MLGPKPLFEPDSLPTCRLRSTENKLFSVLLAIFVVITPTYRFRVFLRGTAGGRVDRPP